MYYLLDAASRTQHTGTGAGRGEHRRGAVRVRGAAGALRAGSLRGGGGHGGSAGLATGTFGRPFGSIQFPNLPGSGGATSSSTENITCQNTPWINLPCLSSSGGGIIRITVGNDFDLDGLLEASGSNGNPGTNAGGGSGGSIYITSFNFTGHGKINVDGGNGTGSGGGGAVLR